MRSFRERSPLAIGVVGIVVLIALLVLAFNLSIFSGGPTYRAAFSDASGIKPGDDVDIAGVQVGKVTSVGLVGAHVRVEFTSSVPLGDQTKAAVGIATLLGSYYLGLSPAGPGRQPYDVEIPESRTTPAFDVVPALQQTAQQAGQINTKQLAQSFEALATAMQGSPKSLRGTLAGLQELSSAVASRDSDLNTLLQHSSHLTSMLATRTGDLSSLVTQGGLLSQQLNQRSQTISQLLTGTIALSQQVTGLITDNKNTLGPALTHLHSVIGILEHNQTNLETSIQELGPFVTETSDLTGNGRWFDYYLQNIIPLPISIQGSNGTSKGKSTLPFLK
jgi:phospholipid/cholesterol/gamma-HCH transport system substrate-binding protein